MSVFSILPESWAGVETWIARIFVSLPEQLSILRCTSIRDDSMPQSHHDNAKHVMQAARRAQQPFPRPIHLLHAVYTYVRLWLASFYRRERQPAAVKQPYLRRREVGKDARALPSIGD